MIYKGYSLMVEQWSSKSHVWVRFLLPLLLKYRFNKRKFKPIKIFNKKKNKIINLNIKFYKKFYKIFYNKNYFEIFNFYKIKNFSLVNYSFYNNFFNLNKFFFYNNFFNLNKKKISITKISFENFFFYILLL